MSGYEVPKAPRFTESDTSFRYSLANYMIGSEDVYYEHPAGQVRLLKYDSLRKDNRTVRAAMVWMDLIAGRQLSENGDKHQVFQLPKSARPLGYEASVTAEGEFTYSDEKLIIDLGVMLGDVYRIDDRRLVVSGNLGRLVAITEFTKPGERQLFLAPGVEKLTLSLGDETSPTAHYAGNSTLWGGKFAHGFELFQQVFNQRINEG